MRNGLGAQRAGRGRGMSAKGERTEESQLETYAADLSRTYAELRRHLNQLTVLHEVNTRIVSALDPDEVLAGMLDSLGQLVTYETAVVYLLDLDVAVPAEGPHTVVPADTPPRVRAGRAFEGGRLHAAEGSTADEDSTVVEAMRGQHTVGRPTAEGTLELVVPLRAGGRSLGALDLRLSEPLPEEDVKVIELLAAAAAVALQNAHLYQETQRLATTDSLTGLSNYRHFHDLLNLEVQRARRMEYPVGLVIMDLDHFKVVNDRHGHPIGDAALRRVAEQLRDSLAAHRRPGPAGWRGVWRNPARRLAARGVRRGRKGPPRGRRDGAVERRYVLARDACYAERRRCVPVG